MKTILLFLQKLLSSSDDVSHKRLIALMSFIMLVFMTIIVMFKYPVNDTLIYIFASLVGGQSILTVIDKFLKK